MTQHDAHPVADTVPEAGVCFARAGEELHLRGESDTALRLLAEGVRLRPRDVTGRLVLARVCRDSGRPDEAVDWLESVLRADPDCPAALIQLAELRSDAKAAAYKRHAFAHEPWDAAVDSGSEDETVPTTAMTAPEVANDVAPEPSAVSWAPPVQEDEDLPEDEDPSNLPNIATVTLAEIYFQQGLKEQAAQIYRQLLERQPGDSSTRKRLEEIETSIAGPDPRATDGNG